MSLRLVHALGESVDVVAGGVPLLRYVYDGAIAPSESPKPYIHPLRTPAGHLVSGFRPHDHRWHKGLQMTVENLSGENFWGGATYVRDEGYVERPNVGITEHDGWDELAAAGGLAWLRERLTWRTQAGDALLRERREITVDTTVDCGAPAYRLGFAMTLENVGGSDLEFASPTTEGRPAAGYGGLVWRGSRAFTGGDVLLPEGALGDDAMGRRAPWLAFVGTHDEVDARSTLVFVDHPTNPRYPNEWFVRSTPIPVVSFGFMFSEVYTLPAGDRLDLSYDVVVADGALDPDAVDRVADSLQEACA
jgi:hypothetical protein